MTRIITHTTRYNFASPVTYALQKVRLRPQSGPLQQVGDWDVTVSGGKIEAQYQDHYGNLVDLVSANVGSQDLVITAQGRVEVTEASGVLGFVYGRAPLWHFLQPTALTKTSPAITKLAKLVGKSDTQLIGLHKLSEAILKAVPYTPGATETTTTAAEAMEIGKGVCQDHSHIFIAAARQAGLPARYVSGYLYMPDHDDQDASHGWAEAHIDGLGWVGFDVSNGISPDTNYVRIAIGRDAQDATPVTGMRMGAGGATMVVSVQVQQ